MADKTVNHWRVICWDFHDVPFRADWFQDWDALIEWLRFNVDAKNASHVDVSFTAGLPGRITEEDLTRDNSHVS